LKSDDNDDDSADSIRHDDNSVDVDVDDGDGDEDGIL
jgi:hypothetical protein